VKKGEKPIHTGRVAKETLESTETDRRRKRWYMIRKQADSLGLSYAHLEDKSMSSDEREAGYKALQQKMREMKKDLGMDNALSDARIKGLDAQIAKNSEEATPQTQAKQELASRELARRSLLHYIERTHPDYEAGWVHEDICRRLEQFVADVEAKKSPRLMLFLPPRSGKSLIASTYFPAWVLGKHPEWEFIMSSYSADLPIGFSRRVRAQLTSPEYKMVFPTTEMSKDSTSAESWRTTSSGGLRAAGVGGGITGMGAHCIPHNAPILWYTPISSIRVGDFVDGYEHSSGRVVRAKVLGVSASSGRKDITAVGDLRCTADHRVFTTDRGYVPAAGLDGANSLVLLPLRWRVLSQGLRGCEAVAEWAVKTVLLQGLLRVQQDRAAALWARMPRMRWAQKVSRSCQVSDLLHQRKQQSLGSTDLRPMWSGVQTDSIRAAKGEERKPRPRVLLANVLRRVQKAASRATEGVRHLPALRGRHYVSLLNWRVLFSQVLPRVASDRTADQRLCWGIPGTEACSSAAGSVPVRFVQQQVTAGDAPHRLRCNAQRDQQLGLVMQGVSRTSTRLGVSAEDLARAGGLQEYVVDIQTTTGNFFAGGVLVHNCFMIDDPIRDQADADSENVRTALWEWYSSTAYTRLAPGAGMVICQTRWHHADLAGQLIDKMNNDLKALTQQLADAREMMEEARSATELEEASAIVDAIQEEYNSIDRWDIVEYQALATADEYLDRVSGRIIKDEDEEPKDPRQYQKLRSKGDALHPARFPRPLLLKYKATMQPRHWAALYQQNPVPDEGLFFTKDLFRFRPHLPQTEELITYAAWDLAIGSKNSNDYTVGIVVGLDYQDNLWVLDMLRGRWGDLDKVANHIVDLHTKYRCSLTGIEKGQLELALKPILSRVMKKRNTYIALAEGESALKPITDKVVRARPLQGRMQQGGVLFPSDQPWVDALRNELLRFPAGVHDDCVDALAWAVRMTSGVAPPVKPSTMAQGEPFDGFKTWRDRLSLIMANGRERSFMAR
jgi:predicted phage terminase large subunit-like protein